jgi:hypoxanthine phosphoribosyltransferase
LSRLEIVLTEQEIRSTVERLAREIKADYEGKNPLLLGVLKGSFVFAADLVRLLDMPLEVEFISLSSYGRGRKESQGKVRVVRGLRTSLKGRHVLVVEDIIDAGVTMDFLIAYLRRRGAASIKVCTLFDKVSRRQVPVPIDYVGLTVPDAFVVGYGLDFDEKYRNLPALYRLEG